MSEHAIKAFIQRWSKVASSERATAVRTALQAHSMSVEVIADQFKHSPRLQRQAVLVTQEEFAMVNQDDGYFRLAA